MNANLDLKMYNVQIIVQVDRGTFDYVCKGWGGGLQRWASQTL